MVSFRFHTSWTTQYFQSLTLSQIFTSTLIAVIGMMIGWYLFIQQPLMKQYTQKQSEQKKLKEKHALSEHEQEEVVHLEKEREQCEQSLRTLLKNCNQIRVALDFLVHLLELNGLSSQDISPLAHHDVTMQDFMRYGVYISARGSYQSMYQFLHELSLRKEFIPTRVKIQKNSKGHLELKLVCNVLAQAEEIG